MDIFTSIKDLLALKATEEAYEDAGRVVLNPEDIKFVLGEVLEAGVEADRVKILGEFEVDIEHRGQEPIRRKVRVSAQN